MKVEYSSNNSGGYWWLKDEDWLALEEAGWTVEWVKDSGCRLRDKDGTRFLGALATKSCREGLSLGDAIKEWEEVTGKSSAALGCSCCGVPHSFTDYDDEDNYIESYSPSYPREGKKYK